MAVGASEVCGIVVTRGDVSLNRVLKPLEVLDEVLIWNNSIDDDLAVYGRYAAIEHTERPVVLVVDDDVALSPEAVQGLLDAYEPGKIIANMPQEYRTRYTDSCLVGFGAIFESDLPRQAFNRFHSAQSAYENFPGHEPEYVFALNGKMEGVAESMLQRTCDVVFTTLTPRLLVDLPFEYLPWTRAENRMYRNQEFLKERQLMLELARKVGNG